MKKTIVFLVTACVLITFQPSYVRASTPNTPIVLTEAQNAKAKSLLLRLDEISHMDKSTLDACDKKELRMEVKSIHRQLRSINGGIYLSGGAVILIVVLLIILL